MEKYVITLEQPRDWHDPTAGSFDQRVEIGIVNGASCNVFEVEGGYLVNDGDRTLRERWLRPMAAACVPAAWVEESADFTSVRVTLGGELDGGKALEKNHLYLVTVADRGFTAKSDSKIMVFGNYTKS